MIDPELIQGTLQSELDRLVNFAKKTMGDESQSYENAFHAQGFAEGVQWAMAVIGVKGWGDATDTLKHLASKQHDQVFNGETDYAAGFDAGY
jgi:hypothetical protein